MKRVQDRRIVRICLLAIAFVVAAGMMSIGTDDVYAASKTPAQVKSVQLSKKTTTSLKVKWEKAKNAKKYEVAYRVSGKGSYKSVKTSSRYRTIKSLKEGTTYQVKVRAINGTKKGKWSSVKKYTTTPKAPSQVKSVEMLTGTTTTIKIKWSKPSYARKYQVAYKKSSASKYTYVKTSNQYYTIKKLKANTKYTVKVRAINGTKYGKWSSARSLWTPSSVTYSKASDESKVKVSATSSKIKIEVKSLGIKSKGTLYRVVPNSYLEADVISGLVETNAKGTKVGDSFMMNKSKTFTIDRKSGDYDRLYDKYYIVQSGKIIKGPIYVTSVTPEKDVTVEMPVSSKKGIVHETSDTTYDISKDLGCNWTAVNIDFTQLVLAEASDNAEQIKVNGKTFYMNKDYVRSLDDKLSRYEDMGVNVVGIVISFVSTEPDSNYPRELKYIDDARWTNGFNTSTTAGRDYFIAGMEFLADRYSQGGNGLICNYIIGNEIDYAYDWNEIIPNKSKSGEALPPRGAIGMRTGEVETRADFNVYMEEYSRALRLANLAVKKYSDDITVGISLSKEWAESKGEQKNSKTSSKWYDTYSPKKMLDWLNYYSKKSGDYDWTITPHNYPIADGNAAAVETGLVADANGKTQAVVTGSIDSSTMITQSNLEVFQMYLNKSYNKFKGAPREIYFTENGSSSHSTDVAPTEEQQAIQAAAIAQYYYRAASMPSVKAIIYYKIKDRAEEGATSYKLGLIDVNGNKKLAYDLWKYIDTDRSFEYSNKYIDKIRFKKDGKEYSVAKGNIKTYRDVMTIVKSSFDWDSYWKWSEAEMTPHQLMAPDTSIISVDETYNSLNGSNELNVTETPAVTEEATEPTESQTIE